jgi:CRP-like cAMP-binding protein
MRRMTFKQGERIFTKGQSSDFAFLILSGKVEIVLERGKVADVIASLEAGEVFGEMGLIDSGPRSASARAAADTVCLAVTADELLKMIETDPKEAVAFVKTLIRRLRAADARLEVSTAMAAVGAP